MAQDSEDIESGGCYLAQTDTAPTALDDTGTFISFAALAYTVNNGKQASKCLLRDISGVFEACQMSALMGPSGCGKTTLLDVLAGRKTTGQITGSVLFNGVKPTKAFLRRYTGYVEQENILLGSLTVKEMLMYTAKLKRAMSESSQTKEWVVTSLIDMLGLTNCADTCIGDARQRGISGGQAKRTSIGMALVSDPTVLLLDEPTSGLDSYSSDEVVELLHSLSRSGVTVVATIHSPTARAFAMFDRLLVLVSGSVAYHGSAASEDVMSYVQLHWSGLGVLLTPGVPAAEYLMNAVTHADRNGNAESLVTAYTQSQLCQENEERVIQMKSPTRQLTFSAIRKPLSRTPSQSSTSADASNDDISGNDSSGRDSNVGAFDITATIHPLSASVGDIPRAKLESGQKYLSFKNSSGLSAFPSTRFSSSQSLHSPSALIATSTSVSTPWWWGLSVLMRYRSRVNFQSPSWLLSRALDQLFVAMLLGTLYWKRGEDLEQGNLTSIVASFFMWTETAVFGALLYVGGVIDERRLFYRERADGLYYVGTYLACKLIEELLQTVCISLGFSLFIFFTARYQGRFIAFWLIHFLALYNGVSLGYFVAAISPDVGMASAVLTITLTIMMALSGNHIVLKNVPIAWRWVSNLSFVRYGWSAFMVNQFEQHDPQFTSEATVLGYYGLETTSVWHNLGYLTAFITTFIFLAYLAMSYISHIKR